MTKINWLLALISLTTLLSGCALGATSAPQEPTPRPTVALKPTPIPTEIKPIESQPTVAPVQDAPVMAYNDIKEGQLLTPGRPDDWVFNGQAGERVNIVLNSQFDSYLELFNPVGEFVASNDDNGDTLNAALFDLQLKSDGPHTIKVYGFDEATGNYALALTGGHPTAGGGLLIDGDSRAVMLSKQGAKWRYEAKAGTYLTVVVKANDLVDSQLTLYGPDGTQQISDDDSAGDLNPEIFEFPLPTAGTYTIQAQTLGDTGMVTLNINSSTVTSGGGPLELGSIISEVLKKGRTHDWTFAGEVDQIVNISMNSREFDTFLELRGSAGNILTENDDTSDSSNSAIELFSLPADDTYTVVARGLSDTDGGTYDLTIKPIKVAPGGGLLLVDTPSQALLVPGQNDSWVFEANKGDFVTITAQSELLDTYFEMYAPDGDTLLTEDDDSGGSINAALLNYPIPQDGEYKLVVRSARPGEGGVYDLLLTTTTELASAGQLISGQPQTSQIDGGDQHTWIFEAEADTFATLKMESDTLDTYLALYDSTGELLDLNDDLLGTNAVIANFTVEETGEYRVIARAYSAEEEGSYTISLELSDQELFIPSSN